MPNRGKESGCMSEERKEGGQVGRRMWAGNALTLETVRGRSQLEATPEEEHWKGVVSA